MSLTTLQLPPGIYRQGTNYQAAARWYQAQFIRFYQQTIRPVGGWVTATSNGDLDGPGRGIVTWREFNNSRACAIGTPNKLWYFDDDQVHDITPTTLGPGNVDSFYGVGYGFGDYGDLTYGFSGGGGPADATQWSLDVFGQYLVACASHDGQVFLWQLDTAVLPTLIDGSAPTGRSAFVTPERFVFVLGANGDPRDVAWPDVDDISDWTPSETNQAGDFPLVTEGALLSGCRVRGQSLLLTTLDAWTATYVGPQIVYSFQQVGYNCGLIADNALVPFLGGAAWMSTNARFFTFNGGVVTPVQGCTVADEIMRDMNLLETAKCHGFHNSAFGEITWWYPSLSTGDMRAVTWNYTESHWTMDGQPARTCAADSGVFDAPLMTSTAGRLSRHETGYLDDTTSRVGQVYLQSGPIELGAGDQVYMARQCFPDELTPGQWELSFTGSFTPEGIVYDKGPVPLLPKTNFRFTGRQIALKLQLVADEEARIGTMRFDVVQGGAR